MKTFKDYLAESARIAEAPVTEDIFDFELDGCLIESEVIEHTEDSITVLVDETAMAMLDNLGMLEAEEDFPLLNPNEKFTLDNPKIITVVDKDEDNLTGADQRQSGMLKAITGSQTIWKKSNTWASAQDSARVMGYMLQYAGDDDTFNASYQGRLPRKEPMMQKGDLPAQSVSPMAEMLRLAGMEEGILDKIKGAFGKTDTPVAAPQAAAAAKPAGNYSGELNGTKLAGLIGYKKANDIGGRLGQKSASKVVAQFPDGKFYDITLDQGQFRVAPSKQSEEGWYGYAIQKQGNAQVRAPSQNFNAAALGEDAIDEAEYRGRKVPLGKPMRGDVKKFKVYVKDPSTGNVKKVNFGDPNMRIKKSNPARRKSFRARHNCANPGPRTKARYWSCRKW